MGWLRKKIKQLGRGIKKVGKKIGKAFKSVLKPFAKIFNKLGPLGSIAMMMILPGLGTALAGWGATLAGGSTFLANMAGTAIKFVGNAINFVATAPQKIFQTITSGISSAWNGLFNKPLTGGTIDAATGAVPDSWWGSFKNEMQNVWGNRGVIDPSTGLIDPAKGTGNFWDVSRIGEQSNKLIKEQWSGTEGFKQDIKNLTATDDSTFLTKVDASKTITDKEALQTFMEKGTVKFNDVTYKLDREGVFGDIIDFTSGTTTKIGDITIPGVGDVRDVATVGSTALGVGSTLAQYGIIGSDDDTRGGYGGMSAQAYAEEQLYGGDQGGMYNITAPVWSYDYNQTFEQNRQNSMNVWNNTYGLPEGFDSSSMPGYGFGWEQWFMQTMGFAPTR